MRPFRKLRVARDVVQFQQATHMDGVIHVRVLPLYLLYKVGRVRHRAGHRIGHTISRTPLSCDHVITFSHTVSIGADVSGPYRPTAASIPSTTPSTSRLICVIPATLATIGAGFSRHRLPRRPQRRSSVATGNLAPSAIALARPHPRIAMRIPPSRPAPDTDIHKTSQSIPRALDLRGIVQRQHHCTRSSRPAHQILCCRVS